MLVASLLGDIFKKICQVFVFWLHWHMWLNFPVTWVHPSCPVLEASPDHDDYCANSDCHEKGAKKDQNVMWDNRYPSVQPSVMAKAKIHASGFSWTLQSQEKRLQCQAAGKCWILHGMTGCLECRLRRLQNYSVCWKLERMEGWKQSWRCSE